MTQYLISDISSNIVDTVAIPRDLHSISYQDRRGLQVYHINRAKVDDQDLNLTTIVAFVPIDGLMEHAAEG